MRQILILFAFVLFGLTACQQSESNPSNAEPEGIPTVASPAIIQPTPTPSLPPTWTPPAPAVNAAGNTVGGETAVNTNTPTNAPIEASGTVYTIQPGDSLGEIAKAFNVSLQELADINNITNWNIIEVGDVLIIPE